MTSGSRKFWTPRGKEEPAPQSRFCDHPGCAETGEFRAPKSRDRLYDYYWFCLDHVRAYNAAWDYYAGLKPDEIEEMVRSDVTWQRPTWPLGHMGTNGRFRIDPDKVKDPFGVFSEEAMGQAARPAGPPPAELAAMRLMELKAPITVEILKARYKELCKLHHPDTNGGDKAAEEMFKRIGQAYKTLMETLEP